jgi:hypothetical protein
MPTDKMPLDKHVLVENRGLIDADVENLVTELQAHHRVLEFFKNLGFLRGGAV